jgi:hypothetical protein
VGDRIDGRPALQGKANVAIVSGGRPFALSTWYEHKDQLLFPSGFRQPDHTAAIGNTFVHDLHTAELSIKRYRGIQVTHV